MLQHSEREEKNPQPHICLIFTPYTVNKAFQKQNTQKEKHCLLMEPVTVTCKVNRIHLKLLQFSNSFAVLKP